MQYFADIVPLRHHENFSICPILRISLFCVAFALQSVNLLLTTKQRTEKMFAKVKPKKCHCGCEKFRKIQAFRVFLEGHSIVNYWTSKGRADVVQRVNERDDLKHFPLEYIAKEPHDFYFECVDNYHQQFETIKF